MKSLDPCDTGRLAAAVWQVVRADGPQRHLMPPLLMQLATTAATLVRVRIGTDDPGDVFWVRLHDGRTVLEIDDVPATTRAMLRAVLALLADHPDDARIHVRAIVDSADPLDQAAAACEAVLWIHNLTDLTHRTADTRGVVLECPSRRC
ncbi:hypothetical protein R1X32_09975 (plasmid) [Rhodococcus opacus]